MATSVLVSVLLLHRPTGDMKIRSEHTNGTSDRWHFATMSRYKVMKARWYDQKQNTKKCGCRQHCCPQSSNGSNISKEPAWWRALVCVLPSPLLCMGSTASGAKIASTSWCTAGALHCLKLFSQKWSSPRFIPDDQSFVVSLKIKFAGTLLSF